jgi:hypothetical protein
LGVVGDPLKQGKQQYRVGGVVKSLKSHKKATKKSTRSGLRSGWGYFCSKLGAQLALPKVTRSFWTKNGPPRGPQIGQEIEKTGARI